MPKCSNGKKSILGFSSLLNFGGGDQTHHLTPQKVDFDANNCVFYNVNKKCYKLEDYILKVKKFVHFRLLFQAVYILSFTFPSAKESFTKNR